jgi:hypothetical protein
MTLERIVAALTWVAGQLPWAIALLNNHLSIYENPAIYEGHELFIIAPIAVGIFATWAVFRFDPGGMLSIAGCFVALLVIVIYILDDVPIDNKIHTYNWFLFYCLPALVLAMFARLIIFLTNYISPSSVPKRFYSNFGNTTDSEFSIDHNLETLDVIVHIASNSGSHEDVAPTRIERTSINRVRIVCPSPPGQDALRAIITA